MGSVTHQPIVVSGLDLSMHEQGKSAIQPQNYQKVEMHNHFILLPTTPSSTHYILHLPPPQHHPTTPRVITIGSSHAHSIYDTPSMYIAVLFVLPMSHLARTFMHPRLCVRHICTNYHFVCYLQQCLVYMWQDDK